MVELTEPFVDTNAIQRTLSDAAAELQSRFAQEGEVYRAEDLQQVLLQWLELSIEALAEDVLFHTIEGDRAYAFNRRAFELQLKKIKPIEGAKTLTQTEVAVAA